MINLPITLNELDKILFALKYTQPSLYAKLWAYKINTLTGDEK
jgi:hypothetical protein